MATKKRRRRKKSIWKSTFYRVYFALVAVAVIGILIGTRYLSGVVKDYETAQPVHAADTAARMFENADYATVYDYDTSAASIANGDKDFYVESMREIAAGKQVTWAAGYSSNEDEQVYNVMLGDEKFAEMTLVPSGETTSHGNRLWKLGSVTTFVALGEQEEVEPEEIEEPVEEVPETPVGEAYRITVPSDSTVSVNGVQLTQDDISIASIAAVADGLLPDGVPVPTLTEYVYYSENGAPQFTVTDRNGNPQQPTESGENAWSCPLPENAELREQYESAVVGVAQQLARLSAKTISKSAMLKYCAKNSPAQKNINNFDDSTGRNKKPESFKDIVSSNYYMYSDDCFSCQVSFTYVSKFTAKVIKEYPTSFTLYFIRQGDGGKLYSFTLY